MVIKIPLVALVVPLVPMVDHGNTIGTTNGLLVALVLTYTVVQDQQVSLWGCKN